jgi:hypothetical protein
MGGVVAGSAKMYKWADSQESTGSRLSCSDRPMSRDSKAAARPRRSACKRVTSTSDIGRFPFASRPQYLSSTICGAVADAGTVTSRTERPDPSGLGMGGANTTRGQIE